MSSQPAVATATEERSGYIAVLVFPLLIVAGGVIGYLAADTVSGAAPFVNPLLGLVMFTMGLTLRPADFALVVRRPLPVVLGVIAQYVMMPLCAVLVVSLLGLPSELAAGVILVGCAPGGTASNVVSYLARGDVALSVAMTSVSTLLAPLLTPLLKLWLAGRYMPLDGAGMARTIVTIVLLPVIAGIIVRLLLAPLAEALLPVLPWLSVAAISVIVAIVVSGHRVFAAMPSSANSAANGAGSVRSVLVRHRMGWILPTNAAMRARSTNPERGGGSATAVTMTSRSALATTMRS